MDVQSIKSVKHNADICMGFGVFIVHSSMAWKMDGGRVGRGKVTQRKSFSVQYRCTVHAALYSTYEPEAVANILPY